MEKISPIPVKLGLNAVGVDDIESLDITFRGQIEVIAEAGGQRCVLLVSTLPYVLEKIDNKALLFGQQPLFVVGFIDQRSLQLARVFGIVTDIIKEEQ